MYTHLQSDTTFMGGLLEGSLNSKIKNEAAHFNFAREHLDKPEAFWFSGQMSPRWFGHMKKEPPLNSVAWWRKCEGLERIFCFWDDAILSKKTWILRPINYWSESPAISQEIEAGPRTIQSIPAKPQINGLKERGCILWIGLLKVWTSI